MRRHEPTCTPLPSILSLRARNRSFCGASSQRCVANRTWRSSPVANVGRTASRQLVICSRGWQCLTPLLPDQGALHVLAAIRSAKLCTRVLVLSGPGNRPSIAELAREGAYCVLSKEVSLAALALCLRDVYCRRRRSSVPKSLNGHSRAVGRPAGDPSNVLTERERQIMQRVCEGLSNKDIGRQFRLSDGTVKVHLHNIYQKLAIRNRTVLALLATDNSHGWDWSRKATDWRQFSQQA